MFRITKTNNNNNKKHNFLCKKDKPCNLHCKQNMLKEVTRRNFTCELFLTICSKASDTLFNSLSPH